MRSVSSLLIGQTQFLRDERRIFRYAAGVTPRIRILFVDRRGEHANRADEEFAILLGGFLQPFDVLFDVAGHLVEVFGQLADFRGAAHRRPLVEFTAADGARGSRQAANRSADAHRKEVSEQDRGEDHHGNERQRLAVQLVDARVGARLFQAALRNYRPVHFRKRAVRPDHFDLAVLVFLRETNRRRAAEVLRQGEHLLDNLGVVRAYVRSRDEILRVRMRDDVAEMIDYENRSPAYAGVSATAAKSARAKPPPLACP